jgi:hypothetical protein
LFYSFFYWGGVHGLKNPPEKVHVSHRCMYVPLISEIMLENVIFGYLKDQGQLMHLFAKLMGQ